MLFLGLGGFGVVVVTGLGSGQQTILELLLFLSHNCGLIDALSNAIIASLQSLMNLQVPEFPESK